MHGAPSPSATARTAAAAAGLNAAVSVLMMIVGLAWIGMAAMSDPAVMAARAVEAPAAFWVQDALKIASVLISVILIIALHRYLRGPIWVAAAGILGEMALLVNAALSISLLLGWTDPVQTMPILGLAALLAAMVGAFWLFALNAVAALRGALPAVLAVVGILAGAAGLYPPFGLAAFALGLVWSIWLCVHLLRQA